MTSEVRSRAQRRVDTVARLEGDRDIWVASADDGHAHLIPLSFAWDGVRIILATPSDSPTARNAATNSSLRLGLGTTRDVTIFEVDVDVVPCPTADAALADLYSRRVGWDPREEAVEHSFLVATPTTARAWRTVPELPGRTIMRSGQWADH